MDSSEDATDCFTFAANADGNNIVARNNYHLQMIETIRCYRVSQSKKVFAKRLLTHTFYDTSDVNITHISHRLPFDKSAKF